MHLGLRVVLPAAIVAFVAGAWTMSLASETAANSANPLNSALLGGVRTAPEDDMAQGPLVEHNPVAQQFGKAEDTLYGASDEISNIRIGWYFNAIDAYEAGLAKHLPIAVVFGTPRCKFCREFIDKALTCASFNRLAGRAVFAYVDPETDGGAKAMTVALRIDAFPTVSVLKPDPSLFYELERINGMFPGDAVLSMFEELPAYFPKAAIGGGSRAQALLTPLAKTKVDPAACSAPAKYK